MLPPTVPASIFVEATALASVVVLHLLNDLVEGSHCGVNILPQLVLQAENQTIQHLDRSLPHLNG